MEWNTVDMLAVVVSNLDIYFPLQVEHHNERKFSINAKISSHILSFPFEINFIC